MGCPLNQYVLVANHWLASNTFGGRIDSAIDYLGGFHFVKNAAYGGVIVHQCATHLGRHLHCHHADILGGILAGSNFLAHLTWLLAVVIKTAVWLIKTGKWKISEFLPGHPGLDGNQREHAQCVNLHLGTTIDGHQQLWVRDQAS